MEGAYEVGDTKSGILIVIRLAPSVYLVLVRKYVLLFLETVTECQRHCLLMKRECPFTQTETAIFYFKPVNQNADLNWQVHGVNMKN